MDINNWTVTVSAPVLDTENNNKANVSVTFVYADGTNTYTFTDSYSGVQGQSDLMSLIQSNLTAHQQCVDTILNTPVGVLDLTQLYPTVTPVEATLAVKSLAQAQVSLKP